MFSIPGVHAPLKLILNEPASPPGVLRNGTAARTARRHWSRCGAPSAMVVNDVIAPLSFTRTS